MQDVLVATDGDEVFDAVDAALSGSEMRCVRAVSGREVLSLVGAFPLDAPPALVVLDLQIGNMGGMAACIALRQEAGAGRLPAVPILMLLDRTPDVFLARRSDADGWLVKPLDSFRLRKAARALLAGERYEEADARNGLGPPGGVRYDRPSTGSSAAWLARSVRDAEVAGSNPAFPTSQGVEGSVPVANHPAFFPRGMNRAPSLSAARWSPSVVACA